MAYDCSYNKYINTQAMLVALRLIGVYLLVTAIANLISLVYVDLDLLISPATTTARYVLLAIAGTGLIFAKKWAFFVYIIAFIINWFTFFTVYQGQASLSSFWLSIPIPLITCALIYCNWDKLS